jgi:hypothetical protein
LFVIKAEHNSLVQFGVVFSLFKRCFVKMVENTFLSDVEVSTAGVLFQVLGKLNNGKRAI